MFVFNYLKSNYLRVEDKDDDKLCNFKRHRFCALLIAITV